MCRDSYYLTHPPVEDNRNNLHNAKIHDFVIQVRKTKSRKTYHLQLLSLIQAQNELLSLNLQDSMTKFII
jgi:hypothetical protein